MTTILLQVCATQRELIHVMMMDISVKMDGMDIYVYMNVDVMKRDQLMENVIQSLDNAFVKSINGVDKDVIYQQVSCNDKLSILQLVNTKFLFLYPN